jgi:hypothetical protein
MPMTREVLAEFEKVPDRQRAEAFSEPFVRPDDFKARTNYPDAVPSIDELIGMGSAFIDDDDELSFGVVLSELNNRPLCNVQTLVAGYREATQEFSAITAEWDSKRREHTLRDTYKATKEAGIRTMAAVAIFAAEKGGDNHIDQLIVPKVVAEGIPLRGVETFIRMSQTTEGQAKIRRQYTELERQFSDSDRTEEGRNAMLDPNNPYHKWYGMLIGSLVLPTASEFIRIADELPLVNGFLSLPRKKRRKAISDEARRAKANWN